MVKGRKRYGGVSCRINEELNYTGKRDVETKGNVAGGQADGAWRFRSTRREELIQFGRRARVERAVHLLGNKNERATMAR